MNQKTYNRIRRQMEKRMGDSAHDRAHVYRVLYAALDIARDIEDLDMDVLLAACLLHDIGREAQAKNPKLCHARAGAKMAYAFLKKLNWPKEKAAHVRDCIRSHRFRGGETPESAEAKILFDADKLDAAGTLGVARTLLYQGIAEGPLYNLDAAGAVLDGNEKGPESFLQEYRYKLAGIYDQFYTPRAREIALTRRQAAISFYESLLAEATAAHAGGKERLEEILTED